MKTSNIPCSLVMVMALVYVGALWSRSAYADQAVVVWNRTDCYCDFDGQSLQCQKLLSGHDIHSTTGLIIAPNQRAKISLVKDGGDNDLELYWKNLEDKIFARPFANPISPQDTTQFVYMFHQPKYTGIEFTSIAYLTDPEKCQIKKYWF